MARLLPTQKTARKTAAKVSEDAPGRAGDSADDVSVAGGSQSLFKTIPKKRKLTLNKKDMSTPANESTEKSGKKDNVQTQPEIKPTLPALITQGALLDSEEETVLALIEGRSPKKSKLKKNFSTKSGVVAAATVTVQDSEKSLPRQAASISKSPNSEDEDFSRTSPAVPEVGQLPAKKRGKKHRHFSKDGSSKEKDKKSKKAKKKEKGMASGGAEGATSPKPSIKEKAEKDKKKKGEKTKKESKKLMKKSTDSGVGFQSKLKKKKVKGDATKND